MIALIQGVLTLDTETFAEFAASRDVFKRGLLIILTVSLLMGFTTSAIDFYKRLTAPPLRERMREAVQGLDEGFRAMRQFAPMDPEMVRKIRRYAKAGIGIGFRIAALPTRLPKQVGSILRAVGSFLSAPFARLSGWMFYALLVLLAAKLLGGKATVQQMLGTTALYSLPHLLDIPAALLGLIPFVGGAARFLLGLASLAWGIAVYIKATAVANEFTTGRAIFAAILPILAMALFLLLVVIIIVGVIAAVM